MRVTGPRATAKRELAAGAALAVLAEQGSRGLTHRAVDQEADLPLGSTSNYFRTRSALLEAALARHIELDLPPAELVEQIGESKLDREQARNLILAALSRVIDPEARPMVAARYELMLESTRRPELRRRYQEARERITDLTEMVLRASGCEESRPHAVQLVALMDGIALDQLMDSESTMDHEGIEAALDRFLVSC
jgi:DNA-binding transcriptional regulator YbjK